MLVRDGPGLRLWEGVEWQDTSPQVSVPGDTELSAEVPLPVGPAKLASGK